MKRIVLLTDAARINESLVRRLRRFFPECEVEIVAVAEGGRPMPSPPTTNPMVSRTRSRDGI